MQQVLYEMDKCGLSALCKTKLCMCKSHVPTLLRKDYTLKSIVGYIAQHVGTQVAQQIRA